MIYNVKAVSRIVMNQILKTGSDNSLFKNDWALISIYSGDEGSKEFLTKDAVKNLSFIKLKYYLSLNFWDITDKDYISIKMNSKFDPILFSDEQAFQVFSFVKKIHELEEKIYLLIHCDAGISRSGAIAEFVQTYCKIDYDVFKKENPNILPNTFIKNKLMRKMYD